MFQTENEICDKFERGLRDEIRALVTVTECKTLEVMKTKAHKMESIIRDRSEHFERKG